MSYKLLILLAASQVVIGAAFLAAAGIVNGLWRWRFPGETKTQNYSPLARQLLIVGMWLFLGGAAGLIVIILSTVPIRRA